MTATDELGVGRGGRRFASETLTRPAGVQAAVRVVVPAAGEGTRLRPLTEDRPKGLVEVAGEPLLARVFDAVDSLPVSALVVVVGYRADAIVDRFGSSYRGTPIRYVRQRERRGLGHAVGLAEPHVDDDFLVVNGDNAIDADLRPIVDHHREASPAATVPVQEVPLETARETGVAVVEGGRVTAVVEKPDDPPSLLALTGVLAVSTEIFDALRRVPPSPRGEIELTDAIDALARAGRRVDAVEFPGWRLNVNTPEDVETAARRFE